MTITAINAKYAKEKEALYFLDELVRLLNSEFKAIRKFIYLDFDETRLPKTAIASVYDEDKGTAYITFNLNKIRKRKYSIQEMREILRHELLHIETGKEDKDLDFTREAYKRKIIVNNDVIKDHAAWLGFENMLELSIDKMFEGKREVNHE